MAATFVILSASMPPQLNSGNCFLLIFQIKILAGNAPVLLFRNTIEHRRKEMPTEKCAAVAARLADREQMC